MFSPTPGSRLGRTRTTRTFPPYVPMPAPTIVGQDNGVAPNTLATTAAIAQGNLVVVCFALYQPTSGPAAVSAVSDGVNTYTRLVHVADPSNQWSAEIWYCLNASAVPSGTNFNFTYSKGPNGSFYGIQITQQSGIIGLDSSNTVSGATTTSVSGTCPSAGSLSSTHTTLYAVLTAGGNVTTAPTSAGWSNIGIGKGTIGGGPGCDFAYDVDTASNAAVTYTATIASNQYALCLAAFVGR